jgi:hypothetical protein
MIGPIAVAIPVVAEIVLAARREQRRVTRILAVRLPSKATLHS